MITESDFRVIITSRDYRRSVVFYSDGLELPVVTSWEEPGSSGTIFKAGGGTIEVVSGGSGEDRIECLNIRLALRTADPDGWCNHLRQKGMTIRDEPADRPWGYRRFVVQDPDGILVSFYTVTDPAAAGHG